MTKYYLSDIRWAYCSKYNWAVPFVYNSDKSQIINLQNNTLIDLPKYKVEIHPDDKVAHIFSFDYDVEYQNIEITDFVHLCKSGLIKLKGLSLRKMRHDLENIKSSQIETIIAEREVDLKTIRKLTDAFHEQLQYSTTNL